MELESGVAEGKAFPVSLNLGIDCRAKVKEVSVVKVTDLVENDEQLKVLAPFGCGIQTGSGTITELGNAQPADTVAILGLGAVGLAAIMV